MEYMYQKEKANKKKMSRKLKSEHRELQLNFLNALNDLTFVSVEKKSKRFSYKESFQSHSWRGHFTIISIYFN